LRHTSSCSHPHTCPACSPSPNTPDRHADVQLDEKFNASFGLSHLIKFSLQYLTSKEDLAKIQAFFKDKDTRRFKLTIEQVYDSIQASINWLERDQEDVNQVRL
jgi:aminopeptidase 2